MVGIGDHIAGVYLVFLQNLGQIAAKGILAHLANEGSLCAQPGGCNCQIGGCAAGVCRKLRNAAFIPAGLGQVDQNFTNRYNIHVYLSLLNVSNKKEAALLLQKIANIGSCALRVRCICNDTEVNGFPESGLGDEWCIGNIQR